KRKEQRTKKKGLDISISTDRACIADHPNASEGKGEAVVSSLIGCFR
ncbi:hypothetical protein LEMLEM_LOCUS12736, partial [Lemmus lemmus]